MGQKEVKMEQQAALAEKVPFPEPSIIMGSYQRNLYLQVSDSLYKLEITIMRVTAGRWQLA